MPLQNFRQNTHPIGVTGNAAFFVDNRLKSYNHYPVTVPPIHKKTRKK